MPGLPQDTRIGVTALTGFLGSGKTTLLNRLLADPRLAHALVIVNELGEAGVDHHLIQELNEDVVLLPGGCMCCSLRGGLADTLRDRFMQALQGRGPRFTRVMIETSGVADPSPIQFTLRHDPFLSQRYRYDHTLAVADAQHVLEQLGRHPEVPRQLALADTLAISKTDLCTGTHLAQVSAALINLNPMAVQFEAPVTRALPFGLFDRLDTVNHVPVPSDIGDADSVDEVPPQWRDWPQRFGRLSAARHTFGINSFVVPLPRQLSRSTLYAAIEAFQADFGSGLLRIKGLAELAGQSGPAVVHAVHNQLYPLGRLPRWPGNSPDPSLIYIMHGDQANHAEKAARQLFAP